MRSAGRISAAYSKMEDQNKYHQDQNIKLQKMKDEQNKRMLDLDIAISHNDDQVSITNERKNILEKISKNILSTHGLQIDPNLSRNFEIKMSEVKKNRNSRRNVLTSQNQSKYLIRLNSSFRVKWDLIVMV